MSVCPRADTFPPKRKWRGGAKESHDVAYLAPLPHPIVIPTALCPPWRLAQRRRSVNLLWRHRFGLGCWSQSVRLQDPPLFLIPHLCRQHPTLQIKSGKTMWTPPSSLPSPAKHTSPKSALPQIHSESATPLRRSAHLIHLSYLDIFSLPSSPLPVPASPACSPYEAEGPLETWTKALLHAICMILGRT